MLILDYKKQYHKQIISSAVKALKAGKVVAFPTDTCYGLAVDASNIKAVKKLYQVKGRDFNKPVHVIVPSMAYAKKIVQWNNNARRLAEKFWPGALTIILPVVGNGLKPFPTRMLSANSGSLGVRMPNNQIALDLSSALKKPITATSANLSGQLDCYSADDIINQFKNEKLKPDIILNAGKLAKRKPSTLVRVFDDVVKVLRQGPVSEKQINSLLNTKIY